MRSSSYDLISWLMNRFSHLPEEKQGSLGRRLPWRRTAYPAPLITMLELAGGRPFHVREGGSRRWRICRRSVSRIDRERERHRPGYYADIVLTIRQTGRYRRRISAKCGWLPFEGYNTFQIAMAREDFREWRSWPMAMESANDAER